MSVKPIRTVSCPQCGEAVEWIEASRYRPFCSARCKGADLGAWASGNYVIPVFNLEDKIEDNDETNDRIN